MLTIGQHTFDSVTVLAPMAGISDRPFRQLCKRYGAGLTVSEMVTSDTSLWHTRKSATRLDHSGETGVRSVQIAGAEPSTMANAARQNEKLGAQIIDINMGCPVKKVCKQAAGSALLRDEKRVSEILQAVVAAVAIPVTLKIRTGWDTDSRNAATIAHIAEQAGIRALTIHGRSRACRFNGTAEYDTIAEVVSKTQLPVIANGDITSAEKAKWVLEYTQAQGIMIGRGAQGRPWLFAQINHYLSTGQHLAEPSAEAILEIVLTHLNELHTFYGDYLGVRIARKHVGWYLKHFANGESLRTQFNQLHSAQDQISCLQSNFDQLISNGEQVA